jgi:hypothetical protein
MTAFPTLELRMDETAGGKKENASSLSPTKAHHNSNWAWYEVRVPFAKSPAVIALALRMEGLGSVWVEDVELLHVPRTGRQ